MSLTLLPESAPFTDEQKAWLNGFLAGMIGLQETATGQMTFPTSATEAVQKEQGTDAAEEEFPWHDPALPLAERMQLAEGKPLPRQLMAAMAQLNCGACGYVCQTYAEALANGEEKNIKLCVPGAKETSKTLKQLLSTIEIPAVTPSSIAVAPATPAEVPAFHRQNPFAATLIRSETLNQHGSAKMVQHVEIDLAGSGLNYQVGDALGVFPTNCEELVSQILAEFPDPSESLVSVNPQNLTFTEALRTCCCLKEITDELIELMQQTATPFDWQTLNELITNDLLDDMDVLDLLHDLPETRPPVTEFVNALRPLAPRLYSIASSQKIVGDMVHLTVGRVISESRQRPRKGVASTLFSDRLQIGEKLRVFVQPSHGFGVPARDEAPLIMIGPGTGIAPFRAFLQERQARKSSGRNWLFFGDQQAATDFLYEQELQEYLATGLLTRLETAFSRDQEQKIYVQHRMLEQAPEFYRWLEEGAFVTVCGDAKRMAVDVDRALHQIIEQCGGKSPEQAKDYVKALTTQGRYLRDIY